MSNINNEDIAVYIEAFKDNVKRLQTNPLYIRGPLTSNPARYGVPDLAEIRVMLLDSRPIFSQKANDPSSLKAIFDIAYESGDKHQQAILSCVYEKIMHHYKSPSNSWFIYNYGRTLEDMSDLIINSYGVHMNVEKLNEIYDMDENDKENFYQDITYKIRPCISYLRLFSLYILRMQKNNILPHIKTFIPNYYPLFGYPKPSNK